LDFKVLVDNPGFIIADLREITNPLDDPEP